jgi:hypothetical protein
MKLIDCALTIALAVSFAPTTAAASEGCYICSSGSSGDCKQCPYGAKDTQEARKACEKRGCKIGGTTSCSTAVNIKSCALPPATSPVTASLTCKSSSAID